VWLCLQRVASVAPTPLAATLFVMFNYQPLIENLALGQANILLLFLVTLAWWGLRAGHPWVAAGTVAAAVHIKLQYGLLLPLLWWIGLRSVCTRALLLAGLGLGAGLLVLGSAHYLEYLRYLLASPDYLLTWTANLSLRSTLHRLLVSFGESRQVTDGLTLAVDGVLLALFARALPRATLPDSSALDWSWGLGLTAILLLSPLTEEHHLVVLLLPLTLLLLTEPVPARRSLELGLLMVAVILLGSRYSFERFELFHQGLLSLLTTGKLLGVVSLAWILMRRLHLTGAGQP
ncbi:MAG: glycosyltransferase 87 family protein, partial [Candidatus Methylomirabilaceae bacterium]